MADDCLFCRIVSGHVASEKVYETDSVLAFHDVNPQAPTHILVIPKKHIARVSELTPADTDVMGDVMLAVKEIADQQNISDFRLAVNNGSGAGQSVFHIHVHLLAGRPLKWPPG